MYENRTLKPVKAILRMGSGNRENNEADEVNSSTLYTYMGMSQQNPQYICYVLKKKH
jgi:hypothetical protein